MESLRGLRENCRYDVGELKSGYPDIADFERKIQVARSYCRALHNIGFVDLLADLNTAGFKAEMLEAGLIWKDLLLEARGRSVTVPVHYCEPLWGVMAIRAFNFAEDVAALSAKEAAPLEYEDEYCYAAFIHELVLHGAEGSGELLNPERVALLQAGLPESRIELCEALLDRDDQAFLEAMGALNGRFEWQMQRMAASMVSPDVYVAAREVWLEGMALLALAERLGMQVEASFKFVHRI